MHLPNCLTIGFLTAALSAQAQDIFITNGNVSFGVEFNNVPLVYSAQVDFLRADPAADIAGVLFKTAWAYRLNGDTREFIFNDANNQVTFSNAGSVGLGTWADVDARGLMSAFVVYEAVPTSPTSGVVTGRMQLTNISAAPLTVSLFHLADMDLCGVNYVSNTATPGSNGHQTYAGVCAETCDHFGGAADRWEIGSYTGVGVNNVDLYTRLEDSALYDLRNDVLPGASSDLRGAYQWQARVLQPGESDTFTIAMAHNVSARAFAFSHFGTGLGGTALGRPILGCSGSAIPGTTMTPAIGNAPAGALGILMYSLGRSVTTVGDLNQWITSPTVNSFAPVGGGGLATFPFAVPNNVALCGTVLFGEGVVFGDASSTSITGLPVTHTNGASWVVGLF